MARNTRSEQDHSEENSGDLILDARQLKAENLSVQLAGILDLKLDTLEAELTLKLDVDKIASLLERAMDMVGERPEMLQNILSSLGNKVEEAADVAGGGEAKITEAAGQKAGELGVDLSTVRGSGSGGRITVGDVEKAAKSDG